MLPAADPEVELLQAVRRLLLAGGPEQVLVDDLVDGDLARITWTGSVAHRRSIAEALGRRDAGEADLLAARAATGEPVGIGGIDYVTSPGAGALVWFTTRRALQGLGLGTRLVNAAEDRIRSRGLAWAVLGVDVRNARARALYERLGYTEVGRGTVTWDIEDARGRPSLQIAELAEMAKRL